MQVEAPSELERHCEEIAPSDRDIIAAANESLESCASLGPDRARPGGMPIVDRWTGSGFTGSSRRIRRRRRRKRGFRRNMMRARRWSSSTTGTRRAATARVGASAWRRFVRRGKLRRPSAACIARARAAIVCDVALARPRLVPRPILSRFHAPALCLTRCTAAARTHATLTSTLSRQSERHRAISAGLPRHLRL